MIAVAIERTFEGWRQAARRLLAAETPPDQVIWSDNDQTALSGLSSSIDESTEAQPSAARVPRDFVRLAQVVACHRDEGRWNLLYRVLWRITHGEHHLLSVAVDEDVHALLMMEKAVRRDRHKMTAFVRFKKLVDESGEHYVAWYQPDHFSLRLALPHFADRFAAMRWAILTPDESVAWDKVELKFGPGVPRRLAPAEDELEELWRSYYASIFNPSRVKVKAMTAEMPKRFWNNLPEAELIPDLLRKARHRSKSMVADAGASAAAGSAAAFVPVATSLQQLKVAAASCRGCELCEHATQTVFGEGPEDAPLVLVGEQPGDQEDRVGRPFVGPAGQVLDDALIAAGIDRKQVYLTNTVKHFKFEVRGHRRIHQTPTARDSVACLPWLEAELALLRPKVLVCLGATAARALIGRGFQVTRERGTFRATNWSPQTTATYHPSALLRIPDPDMRAQAQAFFEADLRAAAVVLAAR